MHKALQKYEAGCEALKDAFLSSLYEGHTEFYDDAYWIGNEKGDVLNWGDWFVNMGDIANYFREEYTPDQFFDWYDYNMEEYSKKKGTILTMRAYKSLILNADPLNSTPGACLGTETIKDPSRKHQPLNRFK